MGNVWGRPRAGAISGLALPLTQTGMPDVTANLDPAMLMRFGGAAVPQDPNKMGVAKPAFLTDNGIRSLWTGSNPDSPQWANDLGEGMNTAMMAAPHLGMIKAYHGSPHDFDAFDMSKIGTGEGAQAYGHGLYVAENPKVAEAYKEAGPAPAAFYDRINAQLSSVANEIDKAKTDYARTRDPASKTAWMDAAKRYDGLMEERSKGVGKTYEVSLDAHPDEFLDWDKPLSEQSPQVQAALNKVLAPEQRAAGIGPATITPRTLEEVQAFRAAGIKGIRYADQGSRWRPEDLTYWQGQLKLYENAAKKLPNDPTVQENLANAQAKIAEHQAHKPTSNFVVFDDRTISILKKYGLAGLTAGLGASAGMMNMPPPAQPEQKKPTPVALLGVRG